MRIPSTASMPSSSGWRSTGEVVVSKAHQIAEATQPPGQPPAQPRRGHGDQQAAGVRSAIIRCPRHLRWHRRPPPGRGSVTQGGLRRTGLCSKGSCPADPSEHPNQCQIPSLQCFPRWRRTIQTPLHIHLPASAPKLSEWTHRRLRRLFHLCVIRKFCRSIMRPCLSSSHSTAPEEKRTNERASAGERQERSFLDVPPLAHRIGEETVV